MKKPLLVAVSGMALLASAPAHADSLPEVYVGVWCFDGNDNKNFTAIGRDEDNCLGDENWLKIDRKSYRRNEDEVCKFISLKHTTQKLSRWITHTVARIVARCEDEGKSWIERLKFSHQQGSLTSKRLDKR
jgi:hypothetical protein